MKYGIQLFIHRYYESIKLTLLIVLVALSVIIILNQIETNNTAAEGRTAAVGTVLDNIKNESENQTEIINRQFRAICIIIIETSGQEGLDKLDPETRSRCENLDAPSQEAEEAQPSAQATPSTLSPSNSFSASSPNLTTSQSTSQPDNSQEPNTQPEEPPQPPEEPTSILPGIDDPIVGCIRLVGEVCI